MARGAPLSTGAPKLTARRSRPFRRSRSTAHRRVLHRRFSAPVMRWRRCRGRTAHSEGRAGPASIITRSPPSHSPRFAPITRRLSRRSTARSPLSASGRRRRAGGTTSRARRATRWLRSVARDEGSIAYHRDSTACSDGLTALAAYTLITAGKDFPGLQELGRHAAEALSAAPEKSAVADCYRDNAKVLAFDSVGANAQAETVRKQMHVQQQAAQPDQWAKVGGRLYTTALTALAAR